VHGEGEGPLCPTAAHQHLIEKRGGAGRLLQCIKGNKAPATRDFTKFLVKAISERQQTWPSQKAVKDGTAPKQTLKEWRENQRLAKVSSPPPRGSPPTSPRPWKETKSQPKTEAKDQPGRKGAVDYKSALEKGKEGAQGRLLKEDEEMLNRRLEKARRILDYVR
jgi:hypothetical protein